MGRTKVSGATLISDATMGDTVWRNLLRVSKTVVAGLLLALLGAYVGSFLLSLAVVGGSLVYDAVFAKPTTDYQWATFALLHTIIYGGLFGALITPTVVAAHSVRRGHTLFAAIVCLTGGSLLLAFSGALVWMVLGALAGSTERSAVLYEGLWQAVKFGSFSLASGSLIAWGVSLVARLQRPG